MREFLSTLTSILDSGRSAAYCRLIETRGSTPQKAGATMLIYPDGSQAGTLGGGCVEADVKRRALGAIASGVPEIATFQLDHDDGWDDGLICGGRMRILIVPLGPEEVTGYLRQMIALAEPGRSYTEGVVVDGGPSGLPAPSCFLFDSQGRLMASLLADRASPPDWLVDALPVAGTKPRPYAVKGVAFLPNRLRCRLLLVGGGHVGQAVGDLAATADFEVWVVDDRAEFVTVERFPKASKRVAGPIGQLLGALEITPETYCVIATRGHHHDTEALFHLAQRGACYVGMIGSRRKIKLIFDDLAAAGIPRDMLDRVYAPLGIDIGSQTVPEIAISICAELISHRNRDGHVPGRESLRAHSPTRAPASP